MNSITTAITTSPFIRVPFTTLVVDGKPLGDWLHQHYPEEELGDLVPSLLPFVQDEDERRVAWERFNQLGTTPVLVPLLIGARDRDFWEVVILVEMTQTKNTVIWSRLGFDVGNGVGFPDTIGKETEWLEPIKALEFDRAQHEAVFQVFSQLMQQEELGNLTDEAAQRS